ncbi:unnamed protein product [Hermetia illucens]|uniref:Uncharacterized protein n=1 Tax=Hermetia illucens TaxID=343691 RepID=A0A7R8YZH0_HERIL|nr:uncharacterized protein LOC119657087 [Hermetia illucens]CAD7090486.1 unnamed protein product [Hermetia illucens]
MSDSDTPNLIDWSLETVENVVSADQTGESSILSPQNILIRVGPHKEPSLDDNPFDVVLNQADLSDDPFELLSRQAELNKLNSNNTCQVETVNLLGLDEASTLNFDCIKGQGNPDANDGAELALAPPKESVSENPCMNSERPMEPSPEKILSNQDSLSTRDETIECTTEPIPNKLENTTEIDASAPVLLDDDSSKSLSKSGGNGSQFINGLRKRLLRLSDSGSSTGSPSRRGSKSGKDIIGDEFSDSFDDINSTNPVWVDSETEQESELEFLKIPILQEIEKTEKTTENRQTILATPKKDAVDALARYKEKMTEKGTNGQNSSNTIDLQAIRERVQRQKLEASNSQDIDDLIASMKQIILKSSDAEQKVEANKLFDSLRTLAGKNTAGTNTHTIDTMDSDPHTNLEVPPTIVRQGTFDLNKSDENEKEATNPSPTPSEILEEAESANSPQFSANISNIVEHIGMLLGNQNVNVLQTGVVPSPANVTNPTYIVVMGTPVLSSRQNTQMALNSTNSPEFESKPRGRSQSLSLHDKSVDRATKPIPNSPSTFSTPSRPYMLKRRSTISYSPATTTQPGARKSLYEPAKAPQKPAPVQRRHTNVINNQHTLLPPRGLPNSIVHTPLELDPKKLKLKSNDNSRRPTGPLRATIPLKKGLSTVTTPYASRSTNSGQLVTSTPIAATNLLETFPVTSTSSLPNGPSSKTNERTQARRSYLSVTPNGKARDRSGVSAVGRKRSLTDSRSSKQSSASYQSNKASHGPAVTMNNAQRRISSNTGTTTLPRSFGSLARSDKENKRPK